MPIMNVYWLIGCSVLDLDAFERCNKAEGLGVSDGTTQAKNLTDTDNACKLFRFLQLLCEGHNLGENDARLTPTDRATRRARRAVSAKLDAECDRRRPFIGRSWTTAVVNVLCCCFSKSIVWGKLMLRSELCWG